jgi:hypothetical protein
MKFYLFFVLFFLNCSKYFYHPSKTTYFEPEKLGFKSEDIFLRMKDLTKIHLLSIAPTEKESKKTIILQLHGNGENSSSHFVSLVWLVNHGYDLITYDYRGYGKSTGNPDPEDIQSDTLEVINSVINKCKKENKKLIIYAQSLGGAIAARAIPELKEKNFLSLVILEGAFADYREVTRSILKKQIIEPIPFILSYVVDNSTSPKDYIEKISPIPLIVIHETEDPVVPFENGKAVFKLSKDPKQFWSVTSDGHIKWMMMGQSPNAKKFVELLDQLVLEGY